MAPKKNKISSIYIFPVLFFVICLSYLARFIFFNIETEIVKYDSVENAIHTTALIVRDESPVMLPGGVEINLKVSEGDRVYTGKKILEVIKGNQADESIAMKIKQLDERIKEIKQSDINNNFFSEDKEKIEEQINEGVEELKNITRSGDYSKFDTTKSNLAANLYKKSLIYGEGSFFGKNLEQLQKEKATLEGLYNNSIDVIYALSSGVVSCTTDGYEQILSPKNIKDFDINSMKEIISSLKIEDSGVSNDSNDSNRDGAAGVKIVDNFEWFTCSLISAEQSKELTSGKRIRLRFSEFGNAEVYGEVYRVSKPEEDTCLVIIKISEHINGFYKKRITEMDIIRDYNEGFTIPAKAIVTRDNIKGVYIIKKGMVKYVPVVVMIEDQERCLVRNYSNEDSALGTDYETLKVFDEVIITTEKVKENQVLTDMI